MVDKKVLDKNLELLNIFYKKKEDRYDKDKLVMVIKDNDNHKKYFNVIEEPDYTFYIAKDDVEISHHLDFIEKDKVEKHTCKYSELTLEIARLAGEEDKFFEMIRSGNGRDTRLFHSLNWIFGSDFDITDYYMKKFLKKFPNGNSELYKGHLDIEVDSMKCTGFPSEDIAPVPINSISLVTSRNEAFLFLLLDEDNKETFTFKEKKVKKFTKEMKELYPEYKLEIEFFDSELELIKGTFNKIHSLNMDFISTWNLRFDIKTIINRIERLGKKYTDILCHPDFKNDLKICYYYDDERNFDKPEDNGSYLQVASYTNWIDSYLLYVSLRKGQESLDTNKLGDVCAQYLGKEKVDYETDGLTIRNLYYKDYEMFVHYSLKDSILLKELEEKLLDIDFIFMLSKLTYTRIFKAMKKTTSLKNCAADFYESLGLIMGNNINSIKGNKTIRFEGAFVADPNLNNNTGIKILGRRSNMIFEDAIDMDFESLYPSEIIAFNIAAHTQIGKLLILNPEKHLPILENNIEEYTELNNLGSQFIAELETKDHIALGTRWFNLPNLEELSMEVQKYVKERKKAS